MGKAKKRNFNKCIKSSGTINTFPEGVSRIDAIKFVCSSIKNNKLDETAISYISLFGITEEELAEAGVSYEALLVLKHLFL